MPQGPGKYDHLATYVREQSGGEGVIVIVLGGNNGSGFSVQLIDQVLTIPLPQLLREMADQIEGDAEFQRVKPNAEAKARS
jgi:hypothetical protein